MVGKKVFMFFLFFIFLFFYFSLRRINSAGVEEEETKGGEKAAPRSPSVDD